jgi:site-specific DNA-methyltransferase (adenine-specific)
MILKQGCCLELLQEEESNSFDFICMDLPYGTTRCKWDSVVDLNRLWPELKRVAKDDCPIVLFAQTPFDKVLGASNLDMLRYEWIWEKTAATGHLNAKKMPMKAHENILVFYSKLPTYNPQKTTGHNPVNSYTKRNGDGECYGKTVEVSGGGATDRYPRSVQLFSSDKQTCKLHPTQKPLALLKYLVSTYSNEGDMCGDFTMGSGTMGVACKELGRNFVGFEKDPCIFKIAQERISAT